MTAVVHHGAPGSYKSFGIMQFKVIPALREGRVVVTNLRGFDSIDRIEAALGERFPDSAAIVAINHDKDGFDLMAKFFHWAPQGALIFMDEVQKIYPTRIKKFDVFDFPDGEDAAEEVGRPATVEDAFDRHRHHNWDIYMATPNIGKVHKEVRQVCEFAYRHRDLSNLLPFHKHCWKEVCHDASTSGQSLTSAIGGHKKYRADKRYFDCYKSTATGVAQESSEDKPLYKEPKLVAFGVVTLICFVFFFYNLSRFGEDRPEELADQSASVAQTVSSAAIADGDAAGNSLSEVSGDAVSVIQPVLMDLDAIYTGSINDRDFFTFKDGDTVFNLSSEDLQAFGITVQRLSSCVVAITRGSLRRLVLCQSQTPELRGAAMQAAVTPVSAMGF
ncbi:zona occludens toxin (predicted ATPase) [Sinobacterium caligoides]|uniref:Zona occludens toxin (Predicted ATPase) n=1 Tax=Sinobacterium caligoides TaxID=933926 RepID=A0A3N2DJQ0_9GAMM|nr:zonular occludens toxin domain-containing protein [Sinobacterium caligoides]ROR99918.1 zona occludens toxin (predicted ATPase) [Sinobacterium caligoides]